MGISLISISHQNAPLSVRELFVFPENVQVDLMKQMLERKSAQECVMISTCNRTEVYTWSDSESSHFTDMQELKKWVKSLEEGQQLFVFGFQEFATMVKRADSQCDGFAVNPGGANIRVTRKMIDTIREAMSGNMRD